jgi:hypothetical protein
MSFAAHLAAADGAALAHLGGAVRYQPDGGAPVDVTGIFDAVYVRADPGGIAGVTSSGPAVFLRLSDLPVDPASDDPTITVGSVEYVVKKVQKDGTGGVLLFLHLKS